MQSVDHERLKPMDRPRLTIFCFGASRRTFELYRNSTTGPDFVNCESQVGFGRENHYDRTILALVDWINVLGFAFLSTVRQRSQRSSSWNGAGLGPYYIQTCKNTRPTQL